MLHENSLKFSFFKEYDDICSSNKWNELFQNIKNSASVKMIDFSSSVARLNENRCRNFYREVVPYDFNRVVLPDLPYLSSDYINASFIKVNGREYIVTQYPYQTEDLFWLMVWHYNCPAIIMLGEPTDKEFESYFPKSKEPMNVRSVENDTGILFSIKLLIKVEYDGFSLEKLNLINTNTNEIREISHATYWSWPDKNIPQCMLSYLALLGITRHLNMLDSSYGPAVVHCSAGAGRAGTFCLTDLALSVVEKEKSLNHVDIPHLFEQLRCQRMGMVCSGKQLRFCYQTIIEAFRRYELCRYVSDNGSYLLCSDEDHVCQNRINEQSSSDDSSSDSVVYFQLSDQDADRSGSEDSLPITDEMHNQDIKYRRGTNRSVSNSYNISKDFIAFPEKVPYNIQPKNKENIDGLPNSCREIILNQRRIKNQEDLNKLSEYLESRKLKRKRLLPSSSVSTSSISLLYEIGMNYRPLLVVFGSFLIYGAYSWFH